MASFIIFRCIGFAQIRYLIDSIFITAVRFVEPGPEVIKLFILNSTEHEICQAHQLLAFKNLLACQILHLSV